MKVLMFGEIKIGDKGIVHQPDLAEAMQVERLTSMPKDVTDLKVVVGKLLKDRKPALLVQCEKKGLPVVTVAELLTPEVVERLASILSRRIKRESYESRALEALTALIVPAAAPEGEPEMSNLELQAKVLAAPTKRRGKKSKAVANG